MIRNNQNVICSDWNSRFCDIVGMYGERTAVSDELRQVTYSELDKETDRAAAVLRSMGVCRGTRVAVMIKNSVNAVAALISVIKAGGAYVPVNPQDAAERKKRIVSDSGSILVLTDSSSDDNMQWSIGKVIYEELASQTADDLGECDSEENDPVYVLYTSGSTGEPKGVVISHGNLSAQMQGINANYGFTEHDVWTQFHTICFDASVLEIFGCLYGGGKLVIVPEKAKYSGKALLDFLISSRASVLALVPSVLYRIPVEEAESGALSVHTMFLGGEKLSFSKLRGWFEKLPDVRIINSYGLTETTVANMGKTVTADMTDSDVSNIGTVYPPNEVCIINDGRLCGAGETGEICLGGPTVSNGYLNKEELNREKFIIVPQLDGGRFFRTGDIGRYLDNGDIEFIGRSDNQVKIRGFRVELEEIENRIRSCPYVRHFAVKLINNNTQIAGFAVLGDPSYDIRDVRNYAKQNLPPYMVPDRWVVMDELPVTERGKLDKSKLVINEREGVLEDYAPCETDTERSILKIWQEDFGDIRIGVHDSYYELGGSSLSVISMLDKVGKLFDTEIPLSEFVRDPNIRSLSRFVENSDIGREEIELSFEKRDTFPMTDLQQAFFIGRHSSVELGNCASHSYAEIRCRDYSFNKVKRIVQKMIKRHELLRCRFDEWGNHHILEDIPVDIKVHDISMLDGADQREAIEAVRTRMESLILDPSEAPLARMEISQTGAAEAIVHLYVDALISDGWSHELMLCEADRLYADENADLGELGFTYSDFVEYSSKLKESEKYDRAKKFWLERVKDMPENPMLPVGKEETCDGHIVSEQKRRYISGDTWNRIEEASAEMGISSFTAALTAFCKAVAKYSKTQRFVINLPVSNRPDIHEDIGKIVGVCSNFFLFDFENISGETLYDTARRVQDRIWELKDNDSFTGNEIIREIYHESGDVGGFVATMVFTSLLDLPMPQKKELEMVYVETHTSQIWMDTVVMHDNDGISFNCDFVKGVLDRELVDRLIEDCIGLLEGLAADSSKWYGQTCIPISESEKAVRAALNDVTEHYDMCSAAESLKRNAERFPDRPAVITRSEVLSYRELYERASVISHALGDVKKGEAVAVVTCKSWYQIASIFGILCAGACYVPIDEEFPQETIAHCLAVSGASVCITDNRNYEKVSGIAGIKAVNAEFIDYENGERAETVHTDMDDLFAVIFTSGTTGAPKGIQLKQGGILNSVYFTNRRYCITENDCAIALTNICHDMSMYDMFGMIEAGASIAVPEKETAREPSAWTEIMERGRVTVWNSVPAFTEMLFMSGDSSVNEVFGNVRLVIQGGDFLKPSLAENIRAASADCILVNVGGPTETSLWSIYHEVTDEEIASGRIPYGRAIANMKHYILNDNREEVPDGVIGSIWSEGIGLAVKYMEQPELTREKFVERGGVRAFNTGDLGYYAPDGEMMICGRNDNQIKINGKRIELEEIEQQINSLHETELVCVVFNRDKKKLAAYYIADKDVDKEDMQAKLSEKLASYMIPSVFIRLESMPYTRNGKINRKELAKRPLDVAVEENVYSEDFADDTDREIYHEVTSVLERDDIPRNANFFMEGGNSILAIHMIAFMQKRFSVKLSIGDLFTSPEINTWHRLVAQKLAANEKSTARNVSDISGGRIPLCSAQTGIWFYESTNDNGKYTVCAYAKISGAYDRARLEKTLNGVLADNRVFALNFGIDEEGMPYQYLNRDRAFEPHEHLPAADDSEAMDIIESCKDDRIDIRSGQLCRFRIIDLPDGSAYLVTLIHHLISDELTIEQLYKDIFTRYDNGGDGEGRTEDGDYISYCMDRGSEDADLSYWKEQFGKVDIYSEQTEKKASWENITDSSELAFDISAQDTEKLKRFCEVNGCTMFCAVYAVFAASMYLYSGKNVIPVNTTFSDRGAVSDTNAYGMFVYNQLIVCEADTSSSLDALAECINRQMMHIYGSRMMSMNDIVRSLELPSEYIDLQSHIVFTMVDNDRVSEHLSDVTVEPVQIVKKVKDTDIDMLIEKVEGRMFGHIYYSQDHMTDADAEELLGRFRQILSSGLEDTSAPIVNIGSDETSEAFAEELEDDLF